MNTWLLACGCSPKMGRTVLIDVAPWSPVPRQLTSRIACWGAVVETLSGLRSEALSVETSEGPPSDSALVGVGAWPFVTGSGRVGEDHRAEHRQ
jgi:hypothetical protein